MCKKTFVYIFSLILVIILGAIIFITPNFISAQTSSDAIAIRVIQNSKNYSAARWYQMRGFTGSPQSILVDGYEAVRDGRTVYVNAANIDGGILYTNIYLISYNQNAEMTTEDIFGKILSHWKFNSSYDTYGTCHRTTATQCLLDSDCPLSEHCLSAKAKIVRDTKRLADLAEIKMMLAAYITDHGTYPKLTAGSYLPQKTLSVWPSWQKVLAQELESDLPTDPINTLGNCGETRFHSETCWDENKKEFAGAVTATSITLPASSYVMAYTTNVKGTSYTVCAVMESGLVSGATSGDCDGTQEVKITESAINQAPRFLNHSLPTGPANTEYVGYISASDPDDDALTWSINTSGTTWTGWSAVPILQSTGLPDQKKVYAAKAGPIGGYPVVVTIDDGRGGVVSETFIISIGNDPPLITAINYTFPASSTISLTYSFTSQDNNQPIAVALTPATLPDGLTVTNATVGTVRTDTLAGVYAATAGNSPVNPTKSFTYIITATDSLGMISTKNITLTWNNNRPRLVTPINCPVKLRAATPFPGCTISATDPDNNPIVSYSLTGASTLSISAAGAITGTTPAAGNYSLQVTANDEYGYASLPANWNLAVTSYCGDGVRQTPNSEAKGGPTNNGQEQCDGNDGVAVTPGESSIVKQYGCTGGCTGTSCAGRCSFTGGYCGDSIINSTLEECDDGNKEDGDECTNACANGCKSITIVSFIANAESGDAVIYGKDTSNNVAVNEISADPYYYLKLAGVMPTPYIWIANSTIGKVAKIRTYAGPKRDCTRDALGNVSCEWVSSTWENMGDLIGVYYVGGTVPANTNPSRTAVNAETGDVWVANRNSNDVYKLDINGNVLKRCDVGGGPRGLAIEQNGDVWVANYSDGNVIKLPGDDSSCAILKTINTGGCPYGLAIDSENDVAVANMCLDTGTIQKINTTDYTFKNYPAPWVYGLTVDNNDNIWGGGYASKGFFKVPAGSADGTSALHFTDNLNYGVLGITADIQGNVWGGTWADNGLVKVNQAGVFQFRRDSYGSDAHGACGDSAGRVWVVNNIGRNTTVYDADGTLQGTFSANDPGEPSDTYAYSDMTGLNRAMVLRSGTWKSKIFDNGKNDMYWGKVSWYQKFQDPAKQQIEVFVRVGDNADLSGASWHSSAIWNSFSPTQREGRYAQIKVKMYSSVKGSSPVLWNLRLTGFGDYCGDGTCQMGESVDNCSQDCP